MGMCPYAYDIGMCWERMRKETALIFFKYITPAFDNRYWEKSQKLKSDLQAEIWIQSRSYDHYTMTLGDKTFLTASNA
jgi:hypothetical protein